MCLQGVQAAVTSEEAPMLDYVAVGQFNSPVRVENMSRHPFNCFLNVLLQLLWSTPEMRHLVAGIGSLDDLIARVRALCQANLDPCDEGRSSWGFSSCGKDVSICKALEAIRGLTFL